MKNSGPGVCLLEGGWAVGVGGTLLGPEGTGCGGLLSLVAGRSSVDCSLVWVGAGCGPGFRPLFENCTVDASIL
jgi:hypothetical protein